jgi:hypothetical protein
MLDRQQTHNRATRAVTLETTPLLIPLGNHEAGTLRSLQWRLLNFGAEVRAGSVRFAPGPLFPELAVRAAGDRLFAASGAQLVLLPSQTATAGLAAPVLPRTPHRVLCYDDLLGTPGSAAPVPRVTGFDQVLGNILEPQDRVTVRRISPPAWGQEPDAYGPLLKLTACRTLPELRPDVVVVSLGREDLLRATVTAEYERQLAALCDSLTGTLKLPLVLVTPPPYPENTERVRMYAAALRRVADVRALPVADLFTAFIGMSEQGTREFFERDGMSLSQAGHNLAAQLIAGTLMARGNAP